MKPEVVDRDWSRIIYHSVVEMHADRVIKYYREAAEDEFAKAMALWALSQRCGFISPKPLELHVAANAVVFERVAKGAPLREAYLRHMLAKGGDAEAPELCGEAGRVLAAIHSEFTLPTRRSWHPPENFLAALPQAQRQYLSKTLTSLPATAPHGDYGLTNITANTGILTVFDPSPNYYSSFDTLASSPIYLDIGHFAAGLVGIVRPSYLMRFRSRNAGPLIDAFLAGYSERAGTRPDRAMVDLFARGIAGAFLRRHYPAFAADLITRAIFLRLQGMFP